MCFSAAASFTVGAALLPAGAYCIRRALKVDRSFLALAAMPLFFCVQQVAEGFVWIGLDRGDTSLTLTSALWFLFFAIPFWPFWVPFSLLLFEIEPPRRLALGLIAALNLAWVVFIYYPIAADPGRRLTIEIVHDSLRYNYSTLPVFQRVSSDWQKIIYLAGVGAPLVIRSGKKHIPFGALVAALAIICQVVFAHAFVSVWCFFASLLALLLCAVFHGLTPARGRLVAG